MDLVDINSSILKSLCKKLKIDYSGEISSEFIRSINSKFTDGKSRSTDLSEIWNIFSQLGIDLSHIDVKQVSEKNELHTYLLLDFLNVLFEALLTDNPAVFNQLLDSFRKPKTRVVKSRSTLKSTDSGRAVQNGRVRLKTGDSGGGKGRSAPGKDKMLGGKEGVNGGGTTSGAEEIDRILAEARRKYGKITSVKDKLGQTSVKEKLGHVATLKNNLEANVSVIKKASDVTEVDNQMKMPIYKKAFSKRISKENVLSSSVSVTSTSSRSTLSTSSKSSYKSSLEWSKNSEGGVDKHGGKSKRRKVSKEGVVGTSREDVVKVVDMVEDAEILNTSDNQVHIRIPLEEASINVKVKSLDGRSLGNRRVHVRLQEEASPQPETKVEYGKKSVLYHHHRKKRPPMFSRAPSPPRLTDNQVLDAAVKIIKKRKHEENAAEEERAEQIKIKRQRSEMTENFDLKMQKYLRDVRTRNGKLRRIAAELEMS